MAILIGLICYLGVEAEVVLVRSVVILDILYAALLLSDLQDVHLECAVVLLELVWLITDLPAEVPLHQEIRGVSMPPMKYVPVVYACDLICLVLRRHLKVVNTIRVACRLFEDRQHPLSEGRYLL
jgi:hypothetical protein